MKHKIDVWGALDVLMFFKLVFYSRQGCIYLIRYTVNLIMYLIYSCNSKLLHTLVSQDSSEPFLYADLIITALLKTAVLLIFVEMVILFFRTFKRIECPNEKAFLEHFTVILINLMHPSSVKFDSVIYLKKKTFTLPLKVWDQ